MRRRALLAALPAAAATALSGCSMLESEESPRETFDVDETTVRTTELEFGDPAPLAPSFDISNGTRQKVAVTPARGLPDEVEVRLGFVSTIDRTQPATLYVSIALPPSADGHLDIPVGATPPLSRYEGVDADSDLRMFLVPRRAGAPMEDVVRRDRGCWRPVLPVGPDDETAGGFHRRSLQPGERLVREYYLVTPWATDRCMQPGTYRFEADAGWSFHVSSFVLDPPDQSKFADAAVPDLPGFPSQRWYHHASAEIYVAPKREEVGLPRATNEFVFQNQTSHPVTIDHQAWQLLKLETDEWYRIAPLAYESERKRVLPGGDATLSLSLFTNPDAPDDEEHRSVGGLAQGLYAVVFPAELQIADPNDGVDASGPTAAIFRIVGNPPALDTTDAVDHVTDRDGVRHVHTTPDESAIATLHLRRRNGTNDHPTGTTTLIREQVLQRDALRDALATIRTDDAPNEVVYHTDPSTIERTTTLIDPDATGLTFTFEDTTYSTNYG